MEPINWRQVEAGGMPALLSALRQLEQGLQEQAAETARLRAALTPAQRMAGWWFQRYAELYRLLVAVGMPAQLEGAEIDAWLRRRLAGGRTAASGSGGRTGDGTDCRRGEG